MTARWAAASILVVCLAAGRFAGAQALGQPDRGSPGDAMIQAHLARLTAEVEGGPWLEGTDTAEQWEQARRGYKAEYMYMLGLDPLPEKTPLKATVTGTLEMDGYVVEKLHYQSSPGLYVTANLYRPAKIEPGAKLPGILYVCGHSSMGRDGGKTAYQSHGIWLGRHGYVCLVVDTLQLGEIEGVHHGTYREGRWWWHSRGYTPAGVEAWNGIRGIDYLTSRPDVDPDKIGVTGISGGGAVTYWVAAADDRVKVAVPVSGMADLESYVPNRVINGHCDCMFVYNTFQWPWTRIAGLIAPRPMLFMNSDHDAIFPMDANARVIARLERLYSRFGAGDRVDSVVSMGGHAYRRDLRESAYRFLNTYLKGDSRPITDSEVDIATEIGRAKHYPIEPDRLRAFPSELPSDSINAKIDETFVPMAKPGLPEKGSYDAWKADLLVELRRVSLRPLPERVPAARLIMAMFGPSPVKLATEKDVAVWMFDKGMHAADARLKRVVLHVIDPNDREDHQEIAPLLREGDKVIPLWTRGVGKDLAWTVKSPPNYVARAHALLGRTVDLGRVWDVAATVRYLRATYKDLPIVVAGSKAAGVIAAHAALVEPEISELVVVDPPASHMAADAPQLLNVLRVLDVPEALGMLAPRALTLQTKDEALAKRVGAIYERAGASDRLTRP